MHLNSC